MSSLAEPDRLIREKKVTASPSWRARKHVLICPINLPRGSGGRDGHLMPRSPKIRQLRSSCDLLCDLLKYIIRRREADRALDLDLQDYRAASPVVRVNDYIIERVPLGSALELDRIDHGAWESAGIAPSQQGEEVRGAYLCLEVATRRPARSWATHVNCHGMLCALSFANSCILQLDAIARFIQTVPQLQAPYR